jgi:hypothetical protein
MHNYNSNDESEYESQDCSDVDVEPEYRQNNDIHIVITTEESILETIKEIEDDLSIVGGVHEALNRIITNENVDIIERLHRLYDEYKNYIEYLKSYERRIRV